MRTSSPPHGVQNESYSIALLIKGRSGGASTKHLYRSGASSTDDHILWLASGITPNLRHDSNTGTVTITSSRLDHQRHRVAYARGHVAPAAARAVPGRHLAGQQHRGEHEHQRCVRHLPLGLGLLHQPGLQRRHRPDPVLRRLLDGPHGPPWHADPFGFLRPWNEVPALMGSAPPATPPSSGTGDRSAKIVCGPLLRQGATTLMG